MFRGKILGIGSNVGRCKGRPPRACPNEGNHRGLPLQKMADNRIKPKYFFNAFGV